MFGRAIVAGFCLSIHLASPACAATAAVPQTAVSKAERFREGIAEIQRRYAVPGFSVAVYSTHGLEAAEAVGRRRAAEPTPVEVSDRFYIGSITKSMTATLAAILVDAGVISWSATPAELWPSEAHRMSPALRSVTLAQLLSHRGGIQPFTQDEEFLGAPATAGSPREQRAVFARWILARPPTSSVGAYIYSNAGYGLAGAMLEQAAGKSWEEMIVQRVFQPLELSSCGFGWPRSAGDQPHGHVLAGSNYVAGSEADSAGIPPVIAPAGGVHCSASDLARFGEAHLLGLAGRHPLLRAQTFQTMHSFPGGEGYALGWGVQEAGSNHLGGVTQGWHALLFVSPSNQIVVAIGVNARAPGRTDELMAEVTQLAFDIFRRSRSPH